MHLSFQFNPFQRQKPGNAVSFLLVSIAIMAISIGITTGVLAPMIGKSVQNKTNTVLVDAAINQHYEMVKQFIQEHPQEILSATNASSIELINPTTSPPTNVLPESMGPTKPCSYVPPGLNLTNSGTLYTNNSLDNLQTCTTTATNNNNVSYQIQTTVTSIQLASNLSSPVTTNNIAPSHRTAGSYQVTIQATIQIQNGSGATPGMASTQISKVFTTTPTGCTGQVANLSNGTLQPTGTGLSLSSAQIDIGISRLSGPFFQMGDFAPSSSDYSSTTGNTNFSICQTIVKDTATTANLACLTAPATGTITLIKGNRIKVNNADVLSSFSVVEKTSAVKLKFWGTDGSSFQPEKSVLLPWSTTSNDPRTDIAIDMLPPDTSGFQVAPIFFIDQNKLFNFTYVTWQNGTIQSTGTDSIFGEGDPPSPTAQQLYNLPLSNNTNINTSVIPNIKDVINSYNTQDTTTVPNVTGQTVDSFSYDSHSKLLAVVVYLPGSGHSLILRRLVANGNGAPSLVAFTNFPPIPLGDSAVPYYKVPQPTISNDGNFVLVRSFNSSSKAAIKAVSTQNITIDANNVINSAGQNYRTIFKDDGTPNNYLSAITYPTTPLSNIYVHYDATRHKFYMFVQGAPNLYEWDPLTWGANTQPVNTSDPNLGPSWIAANANGNAGATSQPNNIQQGVHFNALNYYTSSVLRGINSTAPLLTNYIGNFFTIRVISTPAITATTPALWSIPTSPVVILHNPVTHAMVIQNAFLYRVYPEEGYASIVTPGYDSSNPAVSAQVTTAIDPNTGWFYFEGDSDFAALPPSQLQLSNKSDYGWFFVQNPIQNPSPAGSLFYSADQGTLFFENSKTLQVIQPYCYLNWHPVVTGSTISPNNIDETLYDSRYL